jgi:large subunit ribosomal protein L13
MRTFVASARDVGVRWHVIDAGEQVLGRVATVAARLLQGKHKATYTPFIDTGDHVVIVNAATVKLTGRKELQKIYRRHSGYEGGLREERAKDVRQRQPVRLVEEAVRGMLPKTKLGDAMYR